MENENNNNITDKSHTQTHTHSMSIEISIKLEFITMTSEINSIESSPFVFHFMRSCAVRYFRQYVTIFYSHKCFIRQWWCACIYATCDQFCAFAMHTYIYSFCCVCVFRGVITLNVIYNYLNFFASICIRLEIECDILFEERVFFPFQSMKTTK